MKNKEITVYELIGLIKDNKAPKRIEYDNVIYTLSFNRYYSSEEKDYLFDLFNRNFMDTDIPNIKVKILPEENDEWEDIREIIFLEDEESSDKINRNFEIFANEFNKLIKNQKYLKEKLESKDEK